MKTLDRLNTRLLAEIDSSAKANDRIFGGTGDLLKVGFLCFQPTIILLLQAAVPLLIILVLLKLIF